MQFVKIALGLMKYILLGVFAFGLVLLFDWINLRRLSVIKLLTWVTALALLVYAIIKLILETPRLNLSAFTTPLGLFLLTISVCLLVYSLFIEIPFVTTFATTATNKLVTSGTYALVRHPGVLWLALVFISLLILFPSGILLLAAIVWSGADVLLVFIQDRFLFPKMFPDYFEYRRQTPFLLPTRASFKACLRTLGRKGVSI